MGTAGDWKSAVLWGLFWGAGMLAFTAYTRRKSHIVPALSVADALGWAFMGLWWGIVITFHSRAFHWPLILLTCATFIGGVAVFDGAKGSSGKAN